jgi:isocitrate dehydrogenase
MASTLTTPSAANGQTTRPTTPITVAHGDGIGPEIMKAVLRILKEAGARLDIEEIEIGESVYRRGHSSGIESHSWDSLRRTGVFLKAPITTPQGGGFKSLNVTIRKTLGLYANIRPCVAYHPFVQTRHPRMDLIIVRENEEDLYAGIEHRQTDGRKKVTCFTKDNIMKLTDGLFHKVFDEIAAEYPELAKEHMIVDIGAARLANNPERFDVIVTPNLYGDILSDVAAEIAGSVGLAGSANIGDSIAMFEAIHGSAPDIAGRNLANPSGLLQGAVMMLVHIGDTATAALVQNAWLRTIEDGVHTADFDGVTSGVRAGTTEFADAVIARLGVQPETFRVAAFKQDEPAPAIRVVRRPPAKKEIVGVDVFVHWAGAPAEELAAQLQPAQQQGLLELKMITNRGVKVWPQGFPETFCTDHWRCRFQSPQGNPITHRDVASLLLRLCDTSVDVIKTENLCTFDGEAGYSLGQGQ